MDKLYIVMPAYNEAANIESVVQQWHEIVVKTGADSRLVVVDDGSKDSTYAKLLKLKAQYPQLTALTKSNSGHGSTLLFAYEYALDCGADYVFQTDSDGQTLPEEFWPMWEKRADYAAQIGHRSKRRDGWSRVLVTKVLKIVIYFSFKLWITDANTPFRLMSASSLKKHIKKIPKNYNLSNVLLSVLYEKAPEPIRYIPVTFLPRQGGTNSINIKSITKIGRKAIKDFSSLSKQLK
ncbi:MAG: glycosyltransferase family 2 protein [Lachnospiraceae bacterium]